MAIFSLHHSFIGRTTHPAGAASGFARYITRNEACTTILGERMPQDRSIYAWLDKEEQDDRKNARVIDKVVVALPRELSREQNIELLRAYGERMSGGRASWTAAIHDGPADADNPHAHIIFRDRDIETGRRVMMTTEAGSTQRFRQVWEQEVNIALEPAGREERVDARSLKNQGIDREPQLHVGAGAEALAKRGHEFTSEEKQTTRLIDGRATEVTVNYPTIDEGRTRYEENEERKLRNWLRSEIELNMEGPERPAAMERAFLDSLRFDALYSRAMRSGDVPPEDGSPINAVIREHMTERSHSLESRAPAGPVLHGELYLPRSGPAAAAPVEDTPEIRLRKDELEKLKLTPGMEPVLRASDYLNALTFDRNEPVPSEEDLLAYMMWQRESRMPIAREGRRAAAPLRAAESGEPGERPPRRDASNLISGAGLAVFEKLSDSMETLFDTRTPQQIEKDETVMADQRKIEQLTEQQQRQQEAEAAKWRQIELDLYLAQRDRERHIDRGR